jgi:hypothetical protein
MKDKKKKGQLYKIYSKEEKDDETNEPLCWSNEMGWVDRKDATIFTEKQKEWINLPLGGMWEKYPRLGRVCVNTGYVVDLDNEDMVQHAKDALYEDLENASKHNEWHQWIQIEKKIDAKEVDIPTFLIEEDDEE